MKATLPALLGVTLLIPPVMSHAAGESGVQIQAADQFEYSYSSETQREIVESWLDVSYLTGGFYTGILLNAQQPAEEGTRENRIRHRFFQFTSGDLDLRVGHFYGLFGRGLVFAAYEDRLIRVDTVMDGLFVTARRGRLQSSIFTGTPSALDRDVRGLDSEFDLGRAFTIGATGLTYRADNLSEADGSIHREWVVSGRTTKLFPFGDYYFEYGWKKGYDFQSTPDDRFQSGHAFYGSVNLFTGPAALSLEGKDYQRFAVLRRSDGKATLNRPPALTREHIYSLLGRASHNLDADDEKGVQAEFTFTGPRGWSLLANYSKTERQNGQTLFEEAYGHVEQERWGPFRLRGGFDYQESEGLRQTVITDVTWYIDDVHSLNFDGEHQHVRLGGGENFNLGAYDQQFMKLEFGVAPTWAFSAILELNNKYDEQRDAGEKHPPFPAGQISYTSLQGSTLMLWAGKRQAGQFCSGGVCKYEPAFEGVELTGILRY